MSQKNKKQIPEEEKMENFFDVFMRNYRNVEGFRIIVKLAAYVLFIIIFIVLVNVLGTNDKVINDMPTTTTETKEKYKTYKEILDNAYREIHPYNINITINNEEYKIDAINNVDSVTGYFKTKDKTTEFKIIDNLIYEITLKEEKENAQLFNNIDYEFINIKNLILLLEKNSATKKVEAGITSYEYTIIKDNVNYQITTNVIDEELDKITITSQNANYVIII